MVLHKRIVGLAMAGMLTIGAAQAADERFQTQIDAETARADIVERAAGESPETVRSGSSVWGTHSPINNSIASTAISVINVGAEAALAELQTTQQELADTQRALQTTQRALQVAKSDLNATISDLGKLSNSTAKFKKDMLSELDDIRDSINSGGSGGTTTTSAKNLYVTYKSGTYNNGYFTETMISRQKGRCLLTYYNGTFMSGSITSWSDTYLGTDFSLDTSPQASSQSAARDRIRTKCASGG